MPSAMRAEMCPSPRCSRSSEAAWKRRATGSSGSGSARSAAYMGRPSIGALVAALVSSSTARVKSGVSTRSPRIRRSALTQPSWRAAIAASGVVVLQTFGMCRATSPGPKL